jgi:Zn-dependent protease/CBS domain-containing protein
VREELVMHAFRIGRIFGIDLRVDWSWVFIFVLMTWNLCAVFGGWHPQWPAALRVVVGLAAALVFFGCVLLHELAHSAMALRLGLPVRSITFFLFGGVSNIEKEPPSASAELWIAIVGPLTSLAIGAVFLACGTYATSVAMHDARSVEDAMSKLGPVTTLLVWLGPINTVIGLFNLIPAFPLDGGRVLRALMWRATGNLGEATRRAGAVAQAFGWAFIVLGIAMSFGLRVPFFGSGLVAGMWLAFIGWFVRHAAAQATGQVAVDEAMVGRVVADVMRRGGEVISPDLPLASFVHDHLIRSSQRALPVVLGDRLLGLVSSADIRAVPTGQWPWTRVSSVMRPEALLVVTSPDQPLAAAFHRMMVEDVAQLPVLADGRLVGMLHRRDIVRWLELTWSPRARQGGLTAGGPPLYTRHA